MRLLLDITKHVPRQMMEADDAGSMLPLFTLPLLVLQLLHPEAERVHGEGEDDRGALLG